MSQNNDTKSDIIKYIIGVVIGALFAAAVDVLWVNPTLVKQQVEATKAMEQEAIVQALSKRFEFVDKNSDYEDAIEEVYKAYNEAIKNVAKLEEDNEGLIKQHDETTASNTVDRAKEYAENKEYGLAIDTLNGVSSQTSEITSLIKRYEEKAAEQLWNDVRTKINEGKHDEALKLINEYSYNLPKGYDIEELKREIQSTKPVPISELIDIDSKNWSVNEGEPIDNFGNEHYSAYTSTIVNNNDYWASENEHYVEYRSNKEYKKLTGIISPYEKIEEATVRILFDERIVETYKVGKKTDPIPFEFDISDVDYIRFEVDLLWRSGVIISDVSISK